MIVIDTSAVIAVLSREPDADILAERIAAAAQPRIPAASIVEALVVLDGRSHDDNRPILESFLVDGDVTIEPVTAAQAWVAAEAYRRFGKGRHPAGLNFGDCCAYALAKALGAPLLFKGNDFARTDVTAAVP